MKRVYLIFFWLIILTSISNNIDYNYSEYYQNNSSTHEGEANGNFVTLSSDDEGGMVGLELDCCTTGEIFGLVLIIVIIVGIPSFWVFRKLWKRAVVFFQNRQEERENEVKSFNIKEEFVILSVFLFIIYLFWNNGI